MSDAPPPPGKPPSTREDALAVVRRLREGGHVAYFAGGCVRDALLGLTPKDYDIATDAPPARVRELFPRTQAVGAAFGVVLVRQGRSQIEVATFRSDLAYLDGRRPEGVVFTTAEEDAKRRDFTINGLFYDPVEDRVIDYVGGQEDLRARVLRAIGNPNPRFEEDHLRLLRAVRFAARFDLRIEPATAWAIGHHADMLRRVSPERIAEELRLMLTPASRQAAWPLLWEHHLIQIVMRLLPAGNTATLDRERSIFLALAPGSRVSFGVALATGALCYLRHGTNFTPDVRPMLVPDKVHSMARATRQVLKISNEELEEMAETLLGVGILLQPAELSMASMKRFLARPASAGSRQLLDALASRGLHVERAEWLRPRLAALEQGEYAPRPLLTGDDLTAAGLRPGPVFKTVLNRVYDAQLEGHVATKGEALALGLRIAREGT